MRPLGCRVNPSGGKPAGDSVPSFCGPAAAGQVNLRV